MSRANSQAVAAKVAVEDAQPSDKAQANLRLMSWALSYPSAAVQEHFRTTLAQHDDARQPGGDAGAQ
jgi:hypothetical protein